MIKFINSLTGTEMLVADDRKEEYLAAGHILAVKAPVKAKKAETVKDEPKEPAKEVIRKAPAKKSAPTKKK